jgi:hypothetical protein
MPASETYQWSSDLLRRRDRLPNRSQIYDQSAI